MSHEAETHVPTTLEAEPADALVLRAVPMANALARRYARLGVPLADLQQEGTLGLLDAAARFDPSRGTHFVTYARWWVRYRLQRYLQANRAIVALPRTRALVLVRRKLRRTSAQLERDAEGATTDEEIAEALGVTAEDVALVRAEMSQRTAPLPPTGEAGYVYEPDRAPPSPEDVAARAELHASATRLIGSVLDRLDERERFIVAERRLQESPPSLRTLAEQLEVSAERVRQLEHRALAKMLRGLEEQGCLREAQSCAVELGAAS